MFNWKERFTGQNYSSVPVVIASALCVMIFMTVGGTLVYRNTRTLIKDQETVAHTHEVLAALERTRLFVARVSYLSRLYTVGGDDNDLESARSSAYQLRTTVVHVRELTGDNPGQKKNVQDLSDCTQDLGASLGRLDKGSQPPIGLVQRCDQTLGLMDEQEQRLLRERDENSQHSSYISFVTQLAYAGTALLALIALFGFVLRDAVLRQRIGRQLALNNRQLENSVEKLEQQASESELFSTYRDELQLCLEIGQIYEAASKGLSRLLEDTSGCLCMINSSRNMVEVVSRWGETLVEDFSPPEACCGLRSGHPRWRLPQGSEIHCMHFEGDAPERYLCLPIVAHGNALGMLFIQCETEVIMLKVRERMNTLNQFVQLTGMTVATLNLQKRLENQSIRDGMTGLYNRHLMQLALERELSRSTRRNDTLAVFMLDVDHFKKFNDTFGHAAGDAVLQAVADIFRTHIRAEDIACRYGGEEFTIILPDVTTETAYERAEAIRRAVEGLRVPLEGGRNGEVRISIGVACSPGDGRNGDLLLRRADQALYRAKRSGRNQVCMSETSIAEAVVAGA